MIRLAALALVLSLPTATLARAEEDRWFAHDKALHASAGAVLGAGGYVASAVVFDAPAKRFASGIAVGLGAGAAKEWWDRGHDGQPSWRDFAWDGVGAAAGTTVVWLIDRARHKQSVQPSPSRRHIVLGALPSAVGTFEGVMLPRR